MGTPQAGPIRLPLEPPSAELYHLEGATHDDECVSPSVAGPGLPVPPILPAQQSTKQSTSRRVPSGTDSPQMGESDLVPSPDQHDHQGTKAHRAPAKRLTCCYTQHISAPNI